MDGINNKNPKGDRKWSVDELNDRLYHKDERFDQKARRKIHARDYNLKHDWDEPAEPGQKGFKLPTSFWKKLFLAGFVFLIVALIIAGVSLALKQQRVSDDLIRMELRGQGFIDGGETLNLQIDIQNFNSQPLEEPELIIKYPKDSDAEENDFVFLRRTLDSIDEQELETQQFDIVLFGQEGEEREIEAVLEYKINGSQSIFQKQEIHKTLIRSTPTVLTVDAPESIVKNQEVTFTYTVGANSNTSINDTLFTVEFPRNFELTSVEPQPSFGNNTWFFKTLDLDTQEVVIKGILSAFEGEGQSLRARLGSQNPDTLIDIETVFNSSIHTVWVNKPFVDVNLVVNGETELAVVPGGGTASGVISYTNTLDNAIDNVRFILHLDGSIYDADGIVANNGFFDSNTQSIIWDSTTATELASLAPGQTGIFSFRVDTLDLVQGIGAISDPRYTMSLDIFGVERNGEIREALGVSATEVIANSDLRMLAKTLHYDGPFDNRGPMPPRVGQPTTYTVTWQVTNSANPIEDVKARTQFPTYVRYIGAISPSSEAGNIIYNDTSRELTWNIGDVSPGVGIGVSSPRELSFQIEITPSLSQVGDDPDLTTDISLSGFDLFTEEILINNHRPITTRLKDEPGLSGSDGKVIN